MRMLNLFNADVANSTLPLNMDKSETAVRQLQETAGSGLPFSKKQRSNFQDERYDPKPCISLLPMVFVATISGCA
jgi:hypothetical protein